ncbi:MAG: sporulation protein YtfJ [Clostridiales bacterium]|jgi:sporulation protein YtfJ|nr:sporulation protein YtfJ [Clostridiales bacterium]
MNTEIKNERDNAVYAESIESILNSTMLGFARLIDVNNVVGAPVSLSDGSVVLPVSKISFGFVTGKGEYGESRAKARGNVNYPSAGGGGGGVTITPVGFLVRSADGSGFVRTDGKRGESENVCTDTITDEVKNAGDAGGDKWIDLAKRVIKAVKKN